ncbi:hypothetical protein GDO86_018339 [Hymenochirus boettgeri]|uniref:Guanylate cyclase activator 2B n=1 Tax=Hymenochirus boettgeri TaxID=247094 RepID=A0A8T2IG65_9PIPI|nr:hypothetical protein GDO86_018339 [Hymenochirus boettgeri]
MLTLQSSKDGDFTFTLDDVKKLKELLDQENQVRSRGVSNVGRICEDPNVPAVFKPLCATSHAPEVIHRLEQIALESDVCEVCALAACSGC